MTEKEFQKFLAETIRKRRQQNYLIFGSLAGFFFLILLFGLLAGDDTTAETKRNAAEVIFDSAAYESWGINKNKEIDSLRKMIASLQRKLYKTSDDFRGLDFYSTVKNWPNRKTVYAECSSSGYYYLVSNYHSEDWIFHRSIIIKIGSTIVLESEAVEGFEQNNRTENTADGVWENIQYDNSQSLVQAIGVNKDQVIKVRFVGDKFYDDITLSAGEKSSIANIYYLGRAIKMLEEIERSAYATN